MLKCLNQMFKLKKSIAHQQPDSSSLAILQIRARAATAASLVGLKVGASAFSVALGLSVVLSQDSSNG